MNGSESERYPLGRFERCLEMPDAGRRTALIGVIETTPSEIRGLVASLDAGGLDTPYRDGGWTIRQVVHHVPDSHMNAYLRMKLAVTETAPAIKLYDEVRWAELPDARSGPIGPSLDLLDALHRRWVPFLRALSPEELRMTYLHPDWGAVPVYEGLALYAWHGRHHTAHIRNAVARL